MYTCFRGHDVIETDREWSRMCETKVDEMREVERGKERECVFLKKEYGREGTV